MAIRIMTQGDLTSEAGSMARKIQQIFTRLRVQQILAGGKIARTEP